MVYKFRHKAMQLTGTPVSHCILVVLALLVLIGVVRADSRAANVMINDLGQGTQFIPNNQPITEGGGATQIFLPFVSSDNGQRTLLVEHPPQKLTSSSYNQTHVGNSAVAPPESNNHTFVTDSGGDLDQYVGRADLPNGLLTFSIGINGPVLQLRPDQLSPDGTVAVLPFLELVDQHILPEYAQLTLQVYDVDDSAALSCSEIDHVFINGRQIDDPKRLSPASLSGGTATWNTWTIAFPAYILKYPNAPGVNGALPVAIDNEITIEVDTAECQNAEWSVEVDWGAISVRSAQNYPLFFAHGWKGTPHTFDDFGDYAKEAGIYTYTANIDYGIQPMPQSVKLLKDEINNALTQYNTDRLNLFAHSRGGLFIRSALREHPELAEQINAYVTFATPHHGTDAPLQATWAFHYCTPPTEPELGDPPIPPDYEARCIEIAEQLTIAATRPYNYGERCRLTLEWLPFIEWSWADCLPQWLDGTEHLVRSYTFVGGLGEIWGRSANFPWVAWDAGEYPYPEVRQVDGYYWFHNHLSLKSDRAVYDYAMNLLTAPDAPIAQSAQIEPSNNVSPLYAASTSIAPEVTEQPMYSYAGDLAANSLITFAIPVETITEIRFNVIASTTLSVTLINPSDLLVTPLTAAANPQITYTVTTIDDVNNPYVQYQYHIESPVDGLWQVQIEAVDAAAFVVNATIQSPVALLATTDLGVYTPSQTVLVQTGLVDDLTLQSGAVITGILLLPDDSSLPVIFYDDGTHGDADAGNELYTTQLTAPTYNGRPRLLIQATKGNILRQTEVMFTVAAQTATFEQVTDEAVVDTNNNGYADELNLDVELNVLTAGDYIISGLLADSNGTTLASATYSTIDAETPLVTGTQTVTLSFIGKTLRTTAVDGPYQLKEVTVRYYDPAAYDSFTVDQATNVYTTTTYSANQFEGELVQVVSSAEAVRDINADGLYDSLKISVTLDLLLPGEYSWFGELVAANGDHVTGVEGKGLLDSQTPAVFTLAGWQIHDAALDGPYTLTNVYVTKTTGQVSTHYFDDVHTTAAYQYTQFGSLPFLLNDTTHDLLDVNNNGLADQLLISTTLDLMQVEGDYTWSGRLVAPNGTEVATSAGAGKLYDGKTIVFTFNSPALHDIGLAGPYALRDVTITNQAAPAVTGFFSLLYTTPAYALSTFEDWTFQMSGGSATVTDIDGNGLYDQLVFSTTLEVPWPGQYYLGLRLSGQQGAETATYGLIQSFSGTSNRLITFSGEQINSSGIDGPYLLAIANVEFYPATGGVVRLGISQDVATSATYQASQFQGSPLLSPPTAPTLNQPDNPDNDGNYTVSWTTVAEATGYELQEKPGAFGSYATIYTGTVASVALTNQSPTVYCYRVKSTRGLQASNWSNVVCLTVAQPTNTPTPTPAPTLTPTPTPTGNPVSSPILYLGADGSGTVGGITFADEDILAYDTATDSWSLFFDGSDVGATQDVNAFHLESDGTLLLSFFSPTTLPDVGSVDRGDIIRFTPTSLGETTAGSFSWVLDGSDVELEATSENIDGIGRAPDGRLVVSTYGNYAVTGVSGSDSDLLVFNATTLGETTAGSWELYFDGSAVGLTTSGEDITDLWIDPATGNLYLNSYLTFSVSGLSGDGDDIFICTPSSLGATSACTFYPFWDGDAHGFGFYVDSMSIGVGAPTTPTATPTSGGPTETPTETPIPPTATETVVPTPTETPTAVVDTPTPTATPTETPIPPTATETLVPTVTETPTVTPTGGSSPIIYLGADGSGTVSGITFADEDILAYDTATDSWSLFFDGSDVGATQDVNAFHLESDGTLLLSFLSPTTLADVGTIDRGDIIRFTATSLGETTAGSFSWVLDGSDVELAETSENIDGIGRTPDGRLVVSTYGNYAVTGVSGTDSDLLVFNATTLGETTAGGWELYFDGSDVGLTTSGEDIWDLWIDPATGNLYLNSFLNFGVSSTNSLSGDGDDLFVCVPGTLGETTSCTFSLFWDGDAHGFNFYVDSMSIGGTVPPVSASAQNRQLSEQEMIDVEMTERVFLPLVAR